MCHLLTCLTNAANAHQEDINAVAMMALETSRDLVAGIWLKPVARQQTIPTRSRIRDLKPSTIIPATVSAPSVSLTSEQLSAINIQAMTIACHAATITAQTESIEAIRVTIDQAASDITTNIELCSSNVDLSATHQTSTEAAIAQVENIIESIHSDLRYFHATLNRQLRQSNDAPVSPDGHPPRYTPVHL